MNKQKIIVDISTVIVSLIIILVFAIYCFVPAGHSDYVEGVMWADASLRSGRLLSSDFTYPYAIPIGGNVFIFPYVAILGVCQLSNKLGMFSFYIVLLFVFGFFVNSLFEFNLAKRDLNVSRAKKIKIMICGIAILLMGYRSQVGDNQLRHLLYYQLGHICFVGIIATVVLVLIGKDKRNTWILMITFVLWNSVNGFVQICLATFPILASLVIVLFFYNNRKIIIRCLSIIVVFSVVGFLINRFLMRDILESDYIESNSSYTFQKISAWIDGIRFLPEDWISLFVRVNPLGKNVISISGIEVLICVLFALFVVVVPLLYLLLLRKNWCIEEVFIFISCIFVWGICLLQIIFFRGAVHRTYCFDGTVEQRLLFNCVLVNFVLVCVIYIKYIETIEKKYTKGFFFCMMFFALFSIWLPLKAEWTLDSTLTDELAKNNLNYGFATYWKSNYNTVLSSDEVKIRPVNIVNGEVYSRKYQSDLIWYDKDSDKDDRFFVLMDQTEYEEVINSQNDHLFSLSIKEFEVTEYHVLVFEKKDWELVINN